MPTAELSVKKPDDDICPECLGSCGTWIIGKDDIGRFQKCPTCNGAGKRPRLISDS